MGITYQTKHRHQDTEPEWTIENDRRLEPDGMARSVFWIGVAGWVVLAIALVLLATGAPETVTATQKYRNLATRGWDMGTVKLVLGLFMLQTVINGLGLWFNIQRKRRSTDSWCWSLTSLAPLSIFGVVFCLFLVL